MFVDSHCHLNYLDDPLAALERARERDVPECLCIGVDRSSIEQVLELARHQHGVWASVGEHPGYCSGDAGWVEAYINCPGVVALGETGLDYHHEHSPEQLARQRQTFGQQLALAETAGLPVVVHTRSAEEDTLELLARYPGVSGVLHCFTESWQMAEAALEMGYFISISGIVTFKNADNVREVAQRVPLERLLIETDAPWLAPVPYRGKINEPAYVEATARFLADLRGLDVTELARITRQNFFTLFSRARQDKAFLL